MAKKPRLWGETKKVKNRMRTILSSVALSLILLGCRATESVTIEWSPAMVDTITAHSPLQVRFSGVTGVKSIRGARLVETGVEMQMGPGLNDFVVEPQEILYLDVPGPLRRQTLQGLAIGLVAGTRLFTGDRGSEAGAAPQKREQELGSGASDRWS